MMAARGDHVSAMMAERNALLERACEEALQSGVCGVAEVEGHVPVPLYGVPYGQIYHFPSVDALREWVAGLDEEGQM